MNETHDTAAIKPLPQSEADPRRNKGDAETPALHVEIARLEDAERAEAARQARRKASRDALARAQAALNAELEAPLVPGQPKHSLERIAALRPKAAAEHDIQPRVTP